MEFVNTILQEALQGFDGTDCKEILADLYYAKQRVFGVNDRQSPLVARFLRAWDADPDRYKALYWGVVREMVQKVHFPNEQVMLVQRTPNLRVHLPGQTTIGMRPSDPSPDIVGLHSDGEFGHPREELNCVLALTDMFESNSIYYEDTPDSDTPFECWRCIRLSKGRVWVGDLNQRRHFNRINNTGKARLSLDFRVIPQSAYRGIERSTSATKGARFTPGDYYESMPSNVLQN